MNYHRPRLCPQASVADRRIALPPAKERSAVMERVSQELHRERVADATDCQREMRCIKVDADATIAATRQTIEKSKELIALADELLGRRP